ncbi:hypothetical protein T492DRAFT_1144053 [Pavlovales sp. CCMP2436]|nr:hypothetical protein T492DRAFT_1144053 [Pavlovales sp. CCMP2436]
MAEPRRSNARRCRSYAGRCLWALAAALAFLASSAEEERGRAGSHARRAAPRLAVGGGHRRALTVRTADGRVLPVLRGLPPSVRASAVAAADDGDGDVDDAGADGGCLVLSADAEADGAAGDEGGHITLGALGCARLLALARVKRWWMAPSFGKSAADVPRETQMLLLELSPSGPFVLLLPLVDGPKEAPDAIDLFGWCSWDAYYESVTPDGMTSALRSLAATGAPARWF